jgi:hypothetical protein
MTATGRFEGRYHHNDGYPDGLGATLYELYNGFFEKDLERMLKFLIDDHPAGWSSINGYDFNAEPGWRESSGPANGQSFDDWWSARMSGGPQCYCHGDRSEGEQLITNENASGCGVEWVYAFTRVISGGDYGPVIRNGSSEELAGYKFHKGHGGNNIMLVLSSYCDPKGPNAGQKMIGMFGMGDENAEWKCVKQVNLDLPAPDWEKIS